MDILSLQSRVVWGYVGNAVAVPVLQSLGLNAWPVDTVRLAHHPGHGRTVALRTDADDFAQLLADAAAMIKTPGALLIGYLGNAQQGHVALDFLDREHTVGRDWRLFVDPVFGDDAEGIYVAPDIVEFHRDVTARQAEFLMPNRFELSHLTGMSINGPADAEKAALQVIGWGVANVLVSSVPDGRGIANVLVTRDGTWRASVPSVETVIKGTGDMLSAAFTGMVLSGMSAADALSDSVGMVRQAIDAAAAANAREMGLSGLLQ